MEKFSGYDIGWIGSIALTSSLIRIIQIPLYLLLKPINIDIGFIEKWKYRLFINDLLIDAKRHRINNYELKNLLSFYIISNLLNFLAGLDRSHV